MNIALQRERVTFERQTAVMDENANRMNHWDPVYTCWAYPATSSYQQKETETGGILTSDAGLVFTVRWCEELKDMAEHLKSTNYRVRFLGDTYDISSVDPMNFDHKTIKVSCNRERRDTNVAV